VKKGYKFLNDMGQVFEIVGVNCQIERENGETFTLDASTLQYLLDAKLILKVEGKLECRLPERR
jgi:hypothetical protein